MLEVPNTKTLIFRKLKFDLMSDSFRVKNTERSSFAKRYNHSVDWQKILIDGSPLREAKKMKIIDP